MDVKFMGQAKQLSDAAAKELAKRELLECRDLKDGSKLFLVPELRPDEREFMVYLTAEEALEKCYRSEFVLEATIRFRRVKKLRREVSVTEEYKELEP